MTVESHPHEAWQKQKFGVYHTSNGRRLPTHLAVVSPEEQEENLRRFEEKEPVRRIQNAPFKPVSTMIAGSRAYNNHVGLGDPHALDYGKIGTHVGNVRGIGRAYDSLPEHDDKAIPHFEAMRHEVAAQYDHLTNRMGIKVHPVDHDPYKNVHEMTEDLRNNGRIKVLKTEATGNHPFFSNAENDKFRAVHDAFGHAATGRGFDAHGEEAAFLAHSQMFSRHALPAMAAETRGQNASLHLNGDFPTQRIAVLPHHVLRTPILGHEPVDLNRYRSAGLEDGMNRIAVRVGWAGPGNVRIARVLAEDMPNVIKMAHDSGDSETVFHCAFCGSGQVIARNDGTIECEFCHSCFTVQIQPQYPAFPQTINGMPVQVPGMGPQWPGQPEGAAVGAPAGQEEPEGDEGENPFAASDEDGDEDGDGDSGKDKGENPFAKKSFRTVSGAALHYDQYLKHVALATSRDKNALAARMRQASE